MTTLITGGCGFIGSHLARHVLQSGDSVIVVDDLSTGHRENMPRGAELIQADIVDANTFTPLMSRVDRVFHLAAIASVELSRSEWYRAHQVNIGGTVNLFQAIARAGKRIPVVYASSAAVYGDCKALPISETAATLPLSAYGADKLACEQHGKVAAALHGIPNAGLRFFNVYGPDQDPHSPYSGVISIFMQRASEGKPLTIYGSGEQSRDFVFVEDVVKTMLAAMDKLESGALDCGVFNVGTGKAITIKQLAEMVREISGNDFAIHHGPARDGEIRFSYCKNTLAAEKLGYIPECSLKHGLQLTYDSVKKA